jgi:hypothetical protein
LLNIIVHLKAGIAAVVALEKTVSNEITAVVDNFSVIAAMVEEEEILVEDAITMEEEETTAVVDVITTVEDVITEIINLAATKRDFSEAI